MIFPETNYGKGCFKLQYGVFVTYSALHENSESFIGTDFCNNDLSPE